MESFVGCVKGCFTGCVNDLVGLNGAEEPLSKLSERVSDFSNKEDSWSEEKELAKTRELEKEVDLVDKINVDLNCTIRGDKSRGSMALEKLYLNS